MKKKAFTLLFSLLIAELCFAQNNDKPTIVYEKNGKIRNAEFYNVSKSNIPKDASAFFRDCLKVKSEDGFTEVPNKSDRTGFIDQHYDQYYKGVKVDGAGFNFHFQNGTLNFAHGHYVPIIGLSESPSITPKQAMATFANYKDIPLSTITEFQSTLLIKELITIKVTDTITTPALVYKIYLKSDHKNNDEFGFVDAHEGKVVFVESLFDNTSYVGTFETRYSSAQQATTEFYGNAYNLADFSRGALIHTKNCNNTNDIANAVEVTDANNYWSTAEFSPSNRNMGLDVHWTLQKIYDYLNISYSKNSFDNAGFGIDAYIRYQTPDGGRDNAYWHRGDRVLQFGEGYSLCNPLASIDVVGHEFGHGITYFQMGWDNTGDQKPMNEGLSDIWGAIFEYRIRPVDVWRIGDQITKSNTCLRNIYNPTESGAYTKIASTYLSSRYNSTDPSVKGGVFSRWFYLLTIGGSGTNDIGNYYSVNGIGMDKAESLIVRAVFNNYLDQISTYPDLRSAMINAAKVLFCDNSKEVQAVTNAWYAVGVGASYNSSVTSISGVDRICSYQPYTIVNQPSGITSTSWSSSNASALSVNSSGTATRLNNYNGLVNLYATLLGDSSCTTTTSKEVWVGAPIISYISGNQHPAAAQMDENYYADPFNALAEASYSWQVSPSYFTLWSSGNEARISFPYDGDYWVTANAQNSCGTSNDVQLFVAVGVYEENSIVPNPADDYFTITVADSKALQSSSLLKAKTAIKLSSNASYTVSIINSMGMCVYTTKRNGTSFSIPTSNLKNGSYIVVVDDGKKSYRKHLIVKH